MSWTMIPSAFTFPFPFTVAFALSLTTTLGFLLDGTFMLTLPRNLLRRRVHRKPLRPLPVALLSGKVRSEHVAVTDELLDVESDLHNALRDVLHGGLHPIARRTLEGCENG